MFSLLSNISEEWCMTLAGLRYVCNNISNVPITYSVTLLSCCFNFQHLWNLFTLLLGAKGHSTTWQKLKMGTTREKKKKKVTLKTTTAKNKCLCFLASLIVLLVSCLKADKKQKHIWFSQKGHSPFKQSISISTSAVCIFFFFHIRCC